MAGVVDHYVFENRPDVTEHLPEEGRHPVALTAETAGQIRAKLLRACRDDGEYLSPIVVAEAQTAAGWRGGAGAHNGPRDRPTLVESSRSAPSRGREHHPPLQTFNRVLRIPEADLMRPPAPPSSWHRVRELEEQGHRISFLGTTGRDHWSAGFQHFWLHGLTQGTTRPMTITASRRWPPMPANSRIADNRISYAYQLDATRYAAFLRALARRTAPASRGKIASSSWPARVELAAWCSRAASGSRRCSSTARLSRAADRGRAESGLRRLAPGCPATPPSRFRPQAASAIPHPRHRHDAGWQWRIPLQIAGQGIVYCSRFLDQETALERLLATIEGERLTEPNRLRFIAGVRRKQWHRNCIAVGLSGGFLEPLESTSIHLIQRAVLRLIRMLPLGAVSERDVAEFNDQQLTDFDQVRDFIILHYKATERRDSEFWRYCGGMPIPDTLTQKIELFRETGRVFRKNEELFAENSWIQVMMGQGIVPRSYHPVATKLSEAELASLLTGLREAAAKTVASLPEHHAYIAHYCGAQNKRRHRVARRRQG